MTTTTEEKQTASAGADNSPRCAQATGSDPMHWAHWLWMVPLAITLSPIGTIVLTKALGLDFFGCLKLIGAQCVGFVVLYGLSNGGE